MESAPIWVEELFSKSMRKLSKSKASELLLFGFGLAFLCGEIGPASKIVASQLEEGGDGLNDGGWIVFQIAHVACNSFVKWQISLGQSQAAK